MDVDPNRNYSIWLHFAEIDPAVTGVGQRVFDIIINDDIAFQGVDVVKLSGGCYTALVLNTTVAVNGRSLTITLRPTKGDHAIICAIEIFEIIVAESKTLPDEVKALRTLKHTSGLPVRLGWTGDPCVPQQHPWSGAECHLDRDSSKWVINGLALNNQGLKGFFWDDISKLHHLQSINLSGNNIHGAIPSSLGAIPSLEVLDLSYNSFNGSIPETLGQLTSLRGLNLSGNNLDGAIPSSLGTIPSLEELDLSYNSLNGSIPETLGQLTSLRRLRYLNSNSLSGRVPAALGGRLLHKASFNFTDNHGLCGIPGLRTCGPNLTGGAKIGRAG